MKEIDEIRNSVFDNKFSNHKDSMKLNSTKNPLSSERRSSKNLYPGFDDYPSHQNENISQNANLIPKS